MKWEVKHDRAKRIIDAFLEAAILWQTTGEYQKPDESLFLGLTADEQHLVHEEVELMVSSIRNRYKLQERLPEQKEEAKQEAAPEAPAENPAEAEPVAADPEQVEEAPAEEAKPKRTRKTSGTEKKPAAKKGGRKKAEKEESAE